MECSWLLAVTAGDLNALETRTRRLAGKIVAGSASSPAKRRRLTGEDGPGAALSRQTVRLFLTVYACTNVYENLLIGLLRRKRFTQFVKDLALKSSAGYAAFIAVYALAYKLLRGLLQASLSSLAEYAGQARDVTKGGRARQASNQSTAAQILRSDTLATSIAGALASPALLLDPSPSRRVTMGLYAFAKAIESSWSAASSTGWVPDVLSKNSWWFGPHLLFAFSNAQLLHAFVYDPDCFPDSYSKFILRFSEGYIPQRSTSQLASSPWPQPRQIVDVIASTSSSKRPYPKFESPLLRPGKAVEKNAATALVQPVLDLAHPLHKRLICATLHPDEPLCTKVAVSFARREFVRATRFMAIFSAIRILFSWRKASKDPFAAILRASKFSVGAGTAIASCIGFAWSSICLCQAYLSPYALPTRRFYLQGFIAGLFVLLSPARSADLGMYSARLAALSAWQVAVKRGRVRARRNGEVIPFAFGAGILMALHQHGPKSSTTGLVKRVLNRVAPNDGEAQV